MDNIWYSPDGEKISCTEKLKVMQQNIDELKQVAQDAFEDAVLMGIDPVQIKQCLSEIMQNLINPYEERNESK